MSFNEDAQSGGECSGSQSSSNLESSQQPIGESAFPDEDEETITMMDIIEREDKLEEEASAVLGNSDEKNCTYPNGYIKRQALYSCATCADTSDKMAAICLACSLECHDNHELYELYTKRHYRCDCGNSRFKEGFECKLMNKKAPLNANNKYNHNFVGKYCTCDKRYPPDENDTSAESNYEMYQCIVCEDWYHTKHLGVDELPNKFDELICSGCVTKLDFLHHYEDSETVDKDETEIDTAKVVATNSTSSMPKEEKTVTETSETISKFDEIKQASQPDSVQSSENVDSNNESKIRNITGESDTNDSQLENKDPSHLKNPLDKPIENIITTETNDECMLVKLKMNKQIKDDTNCVTEESLVTKHKSIFWPNCSWRSKLCRCQKCMTMYKEKECDFLLDETDTVQYYEAQGKVLAKERATPLERGMTALNSMGNRAAVVEALHGYDELKADLSIYLRKFADAKQVVRESDIHDFFAQLKSKKRPRLEYE